MRAYDRRLSIIEILSDERRSTIHSLMNRFNVSRNTIIEDIRVLSCRFPIVTVSGRNGGIEVIGDWRLGERFLRPSQEEVLVELSRAEYVPEEYRIVIGSILESFGRGI